MTSYPEVGKIDTTDIGNAGRFVHQHGGDLRYLAASDCWLVWDGKRWARDELCEVLARAKKTALSIFGEVEHNPSDAARKDLAKHAFTSQNYSRLRAMIACAEPEFAIRSTALDTDRMLFNALNGTLDLRSGVLRPHDRRDMITRLAPIAYDPAAQCPRFETFLLEIMNGDLEMAGFLQRAIGYSLTGDTREQVLFLLHGSGSNGKSVLLDLLHALLGEADGSYSGRADFKTFTEQQRGDRPRNDIARLDGCRLVSALEIGDGVRLDEGVVKQMTGSDRLTARKLYSEFFEFVPQFKLWLAANHRPIIKGTDHAMWRRVLLLPFNVTFHGEGRDDQLSAKLRAELPGILRWAVEGCSAWLELGLRPPAGVVAATEDYRAESDVLGAFLTDRCALTDRTPATELYGAYTRWAARNGEHAMTATMFGRRLTERGFAVEKRGGVKWRIGVQLLAEADDQDSSGQFRTVQGQLPTGVGTVRTVPPTVRMTRAHKETLLGNGPNCPTVLNGEPSRGRLNV